ncbi:IPTL-CTERM sorting domain-containing protein [Acidobacteriota bacterium]
MKTGKLVRGNLVKLGICLIAFLLIPLYSNAQQVAGGCLESAANCTANDLDVLSYDVTPVTSCSGVGDTIDVLIDMTIERGGGGTRYDLGFWVATDGDNVQGGPNCVRETTSDLTPPLLDGDGDTCSDITGGATYTYTMAATVDCVDADHDGYLDPISAAVSWFQNTGVVCTDANDITPGTVAKCFGAEPTGQQIEVPRGPGGIDVTKIAEPTEVDSPGGDVIFTVTVFNTSQTEEFDLVSLVDDVYGDLNGMGDCSVPQTIAVDDSYTCTFTDFIGEDHINTVTAAGNYPNQPPLSEQGQDDATVVIAAAIPTTTEWGMILLALLLAALGGFALRRRERKVGE